MGSVVELHNVWKIYRVGPVEYPALRGVSLSIEEGDFIAVVGPSGSGKSTLLHIMGTLDRPTKGEVYIEGNSVSSLSDSGLARLRNKYIGFVFQQYNLVPYLNALENVELPLVASGAPLRQRRERAKGLLEELGLGDKIFKKPFELSGGEQQRVAIARALANDPKVILADEPTGNLDSYNAKIVVDILKRINSERGVTIVVVTHNMEVAEAAEKMIHLRDGRIVGEKRKTP